MKIGAGKRRKEKEKMHHRGSEGREGVRAGEIDGGVGEMTCPISVQMGLGRGVIWDTTCQINGNRVRPPMGKIRGCRHEKSPGLNLTWVAEHCGMHGKRRRKVTNRPTDNI